MANLIVFKKNVDIGAADAESDDTFLSECFVDTGDLQTLLDCQSPKCLVLGRTGSGKTALLTELRRKAEHVVELAPEALALNYVANSQILQFFEEAGVSLDLFYTLLWRHILTVELLRLRYDITSEAKQHDFTDRIAAILNRNSPRQRALRYLSDWGDKFWSSTEQRVAEFTRKLETDLSGAAKVEYSFISLGVEGARKLTEEQRIEVREAGTRVVNQVQVKDLYEVIELLKEDIFNDPQKRYYLTIDRLDEEWVDDKIRFKLIKALIESLRTFKMIKTVKIVVALRADLHARVIAETSQPGFQEEKYRSLYLSLRWTREQLVSILRERVNFMFKRQYTSSNVKLEEILPSNQIDRRSAIDYIIDRTFFRPREAIIYLNECISHSVGQSKITVNVLRQAESAYSKQRLVSLNHEWRRDFPSLGRATKLLNRRDNPFTLSEITYDDATDLALWILEPQEAIKDSIFNDSIKFYIEGSITYIQFLERIIATFYAIGLVGVKIESHLPRQWSFSDDPSLNPEQIRNDTHIYIHKTFWAGLGISPKTRDFE